MKRARLHPDAPRREVRREEPRWCGGARAARCPGRCRHGDARWACVRGTPCVTGGFISGDVLTLSGVITAINNPALLGSLGTVVGNASTGAITFYLGPLAGGPFSGQTIVGEGFGNVKIRQ